MNEFRLRPEKFSEARKMMLLRISIVFPIAVFGGLLASGNQLRSLTILLTLVVAGIAGYIGFRIALRRQKSAWDSYRLIISDSHVMRKMENHPDIEISKESLSEIRELKDGSLLIKGKSNRELIPVSVNLENFQEAKGLIYGLRR